MTRATTFSPESSIRSCLSQEWWSGRIRCRTESTRMKGNRSFPGSCPRGPLVKKGDLVCQLDSGALENQLKTQTGLVKSAERAVQAARILKEAAQAAFLEYTKRKRFPAERREGARGPCRGPEGKRIRGAGDLGRRQGEGSEAQAPDATLRPACPQRWPRCSRQRYVVQVQQSHQHRQWRDCSRAADHLHDVRPEKPATGDDSFAGMERSPCRLARKYGSRAATLP